MKLDFELMNSLEKKRLLKNMIFKTKLTLKKKLELINIINKSSDDELLQILKELDTYYLNNN